MFDTRKKATMPQVLADIKLYLTKRFLSEPVIDDRCLPVICQVLLRRYSNVKLVQGVTDNKPNLRIRVEGALSTKERSFEVVHTGGRKSVVPDRCTGGGTEAALSDLRTQRRRQKAEYQGAPFVDVFLVNLILSDEDSDRACIVDVGDTGISYVIPWSSIPQELQQPLRRYVAQADGKLCGYCKENLCNTENGRMIVELYLGKQEHHVSRILY